MTALTADRNTPAAAGDVEEYPMLAAAAIFAGAIVVLDSSGWAKSGAAATGLVCVGRSEARVDNSDGANGALSVRVRRGVFRYANSADGDEITRAEIGDNCYLVDDQTVAKTSDSNSRSVAGRIEQVDANGVWVRMGSSLLAAPGGALLAANNFSDIGTPATARANLGVDAGMGAPAVVVGADAGTTVAITIQLKDVAGDDLAVRGTVLAYLSDDANGDSIAGTAPDGGIAIGSDGLLIPVVAGKTFHLVSEADGDIDLVVTESGADTWYLILAMPDGRLVASDAITFS